MMYQLPGNRQITAEKLLNKLIHSILMKIRNFLPIPVILFLSMVNCNAQELNDTILAIKEGIWFAGDDRETDKVQWARGIVRTRINNYPSLIVIRKVIEPMPLPLEEIRGEMMSGYQEFLENEWSYN